MQDINQQLYERKDTPEGFIPVYGVVITVPTGIYTSGQKDFTCDKTFDEVKEIFKANGVKVTKARLLIYDLLKESDRSVTADYIYSKCKEINLSTVYRTLEVFLEKDLVDKFELGDGKSSYKLKNRNIHKHILECDLCHKEIEVPCPMQQIEELLRNQTGFKVKEHNLTLKGICEECIDNKKK